MKFIQQNSPESSPHHYLLIGDQTRSIVFFQETIRSNFWPKLSLPKNETTYQVHKALVRTRTLQSTSKCEPPPKAFSVRVVKYWNKLPASIVTAPSVKVFKKRLEKVWTEIFPHFRHWLNTHHHPPSSNPPFPPAHHPFTVIISILYPTPCYVYVFSSGPLWPAFTIINHYNNQKVSECHVIYQAR